MAASPRNSLLPALESRAPPPSPVAGAHFHGPASPEHDKLDGFLSQSLRVPKLSLPLRIFPQEATAWNPPEIDFRRLISSEDDGPSVKLLKSTAAAFGCFQLVNHGIPRDLITAVRTAVTLAFQIPSEKKLSAARRSPERRWGFEVDEEGEGEELFWWGGIEMRDKEQLARTWPKIYEDFSVKLESLKIEIEKIARKIGELLLVEDHHGGTKLSKLGSSQKIVDTSILCFHKHSHQNGGGDGGTKHHELLRILMRRSWSCSSSLILHFDSGEASEFHVYSKRGWFRFRQKNAAFVVTVGGHFQACSGGFYKHVVGKTVFHHGDDRDSVSIALHYKQPAIDASPSPPTAEERTISLAEQVMVAACFMLLCHFLVFVHGSF